MPTEQHTFPGSHSGDDMAALVPSHPPCECPRCGYDLSAIPPSWEELCPVSGVCSECGLEVEWGELLGRHTPPPDWFAEREGSRLPPGPRMSVRTWLRVMTPGRFWSAIKLGHKPDFNALFGFTLIALLMIYVCAASWVVMQGLGVLGRRWPLSFTLIVLAWPWARSTNPYFWIVPAASVLAPTVFLVLGTTLSSARVRLAHVWRAGVYGLLGVATIMLVARLLRIAILLVTPRRNIGVPGNPWEFLVVSGFRSSWAMLFAAVWLGVFWWYAVSRYMKLDHPRAVTASIMSIALLGGLAVVQWWPGHQWEWWNQNLFRVFFW